jgi:putative pyruvate formate lyase activating enzyme
MFRQTGPLRMDDAGIAYRGLCIRHLVLPGGHAHSEKVLAFINNHFDPDDITLSLMAQYRPLHEAARFPELNAALRDEDYAPTRRMFIDAGITGYYQERQCLDTSFCIDFENGKSALLP